jgi:hypothetical protein
LPAAFSFSIGRESISVYSPGSILPQVCTRGNLFDFGSGVQRLRHCCGSRERNRSALDLQRRTWGCCGFGEASGASGMGRMQMPLHVETSARQRKNNCNCNCNCNCEGVVLAGGTSTSSTTVSFLYVIHGIQKLKL